MFGHLQVYAPRERALVGLADLAIAPLGWGRSRRAAVAAPARVLLLRLERIGDLLMTLDAIHDARRQWPGAEIDLAVGSWNAQLAALVPGITRVETLDVPWLARESAGDRWATLVTRARAWRDRRYDVIVNFEPDIRTNFLAWVAGAPVRAGYWTGGGGALLTDARAYDPTAHVSTNARALVAHVAGRAPTGAATASMSRLQPPAEAQAHASAILRDARPPLVGVHASGGRESKQWHLDRFAAVARELARTDEATIVLTGSGGDRALVDRVRAAIGSDVRVIDIAGQVDLPAFAALLSRLDVLVTGDTGPMHLAAAVGTPVVALFGPSNPARYGPLGDGHRVIRIDLPCAPCGQVRLPPERCRGHVPDCLDGISAATVVAAARDLLARRAGVVRA